MTLVTSRRAFLTGLSAALAAPAIVRAASLMPIRAPGLITGVDLGAGDATVAYTYDCARRTLVPIVYSGARGGGKSALMLSQITREAVRLFTNSNVFLKNIDEHYANRFPICSQLRIRLPSDYSDA